FFFQAEDGIRDRTVTGVQTCALPIFRVDQDGRLALLDGVVVAPLVRIGPPEIGMRLGRRTLLDRRLVQTHRGVEITGLLALVGEIGRASCRERVEIWVWVGCV